MIDLGIIIQKFIEHYGVFSIFGIVFLEYSNIPIPSEIVLPLIGVLIVAGKINLWEGLLFSILAGVLGCLFTYLLGFYFGRSLLDKIIIKFPKMKRSVDASLNWIKRYGKMSVLVARIMPVGRTFISIPAGVIRMNIISFVIYSGIGIAMWNSVLISIGLFFGKNIPVVMTLLKKNILFVILLIIVIGVNYKEKNKKQL